MDSTTKAVREMYEEYPYPTGTPQIRAASDARLILSYVERARPGPGPIHVLDAGCGRGLGLLGGAMVQPDVRFTGIDINRVALAEAKAYANQHGLTNVNIHECDLMTLDGLEAPEGGFDVIYSLGVVHHMADPLTGLRNLRKALAPHGAIVFMVYAKRGREPLRRVANATRLLVPPDASLPASVEVGRQLAAFARDGILANTFWENSADVSDVEFVDRFLNVNEACYDVESLWKLIADAGLRFNRWIEPDEWSAHKIFPEGELRARALRLDELSRYKLIEQICRRNSFEMVLSPAESAPRKAPTDADLDGRFFALNPDVAIIYEKRNLRGSQRIERISYALRHRPPVRLDKGPLATAITAMEHQLEPFDCALWIEAMSKMQMPPEQARAVLLELVNLEILYCPHQADL